MTFTRNRLTVVILIALVVLAAVVMLPLRKSSGAGAAKFDLSKGGAPNIDVNATAGAARNATSAQVAALNQFKSNYGGASVRWNSFAGSPDVMMGFHMGASSDTPENVARTFIAANSSLFGADPTTLKLVDQKEAFGGYVVKFQQNVGGAEVVNGGGGFVLTAEKKNSIGRGSAVPECDMGNDPASQP